MNILLAFPVADGRTGRFLERAFKKLGHNVTVVDAKLSPHLTYSTFNSGLYNLVFCSRTPALLPEIKQIKAMSNVPVVVFNTDKRQNVLSFGDKLMELFKIVDILFTASEGNVSDYRQHCPDTIVKYLPQGCDPLTHHVPAKITDEDRDKYSCSVAFAGSISKVHVGRAELLKYLQDNGVNINLYGPCAGKPKTLGEDLCKAYFLAKIVLGHNGGMGNLSRSSSVRDYIVPATGSFLLTEHCEGMETIFGGFADFYKTKEECLEKIKYYLEHEQEREIMAEIGYEVVNRKHKYLNRMEELIREVEQFRLL